jgi:hypothetical protein
MHKHQAGARSDFAAEALRSDFDELVAIFDCQLSRLTPAESIMRSHVSEAKGAAERGRRLSHELSVLLRTRH